MSNVMQSTKISDTYDPVFKKPILGDNEYGYCIERLLKHITNKETFSEEDHKNKIYLLCALLSNETIEFINRVNQLGILMNNANMAEVLIKEDEIIELIKGWLLRKGKKKGYYISTIDNKSYFVGIFNHFEKALKTDSDFLEKFKKTVKKRIKNGPEGENTDKLELLYDKIKNLITDNSKAAKVKHKTSNNCNNIV